MSTFWLNLIWASSFLPKQQQTPSFPMSKAQLGTNLFQHETYIENTPFLMMKHGWSYADRSQK
jgi:hypothetical protein